MTTRPQGGILHEILESFSFEATLAISGEERLADVERASHDAPFGLVIMDWKMPGPDGINVEAGLQRLLGNKRTYRRILVKFRDEFQHAAQTV